MDIANHMCMVPTTILLASSEIYLTKSYFWESSPESAGSALSGRG